MPKIKPFIWEKSSVANHEFTETLFGYYGVHGFTDQDGLMKYHAVGIVEFDDETMKFETIEQAKQYAFDDFKRRLEETLDVSIGIDS